MVSSVASDAGYLVLIPLGAAAFISVGRHPLAGIAAAFAGVAAGFGVNFLITPIDGMLTEITNDASALVDPGAEIDLVSNLYFGIGSAILVVIVCTAMTSRLVEGRLGDYDPADGGTAAEAAQDDEVAPDDEARGLRYALWGTLAVLAVIALLTVIPGAPLRDPDTDRVIGDSPFMDSLIVIIALVFLVAGLCYGRGAGTIAGKDEALASITKSWAGLAGPAVPVPADRAVHRVLQLQQHGAGRRRGARRRARADRHRCRVAADRRDRHHHGRRPDHARRDREVGDPGADLHPAVPPPGRRSPDRAGRVPRRRLAAQRDHAADGLLPAHRRVRPALPAQRRHRHRRLADAALRGHPRGDLDAVLRGLVPASGSRSAPERPCTRDEVRRPARRSAGPCRAARTGTGPRAVP